MAKPKIPTQPPQPLLTYRETAAQLGVSYGTIRRYAAEGRIEVVHLTGKTRRIEQSEIDSFVARSRVPAA